jgi:hypothetical protein
MCKCFSSEKSYKATSWIVNGNLKIKFTGVLDDFLHIGFEVFLKEKILSNDGQLTMNFNRIEQRQELINQSLVERCEALDKRCNALEAQLEKQSKEFYQILDQLDVLLFPTNQISCQTQFPLAMPKISSETLEINSQDFGYMRFENLSKFYQLKKLVIRQFYNVASDLTRLSNKTVTDLQLICQNQGTFTSLKGLDNFPNLTSLTVIGAPNLTNVVATLKSVPHKIKTFKFRTCAGINVVEMQTYCQENKFFVAFS